MCALYLRMTDNKKHFESFELKLGNFKTGVDVGNNTNLAIVYANCDESR